MLSWISYNTKLVTGSFNYLTGYRTVVSYSSWDFFQLFPVYSYVPIFERVNYSDQPAAGVA